MDATIVINGATIRVQVTGLSASVAWICHAKVTTVKY